MPTDYERISNAAFERHARRRLEAMTQDERVTAYTRSLNRYRRRPDEIKDVLLDRRPDIERQPGQGDGGEARHIIGRCKVPSGAPQTILFILRVSEREVFFPLRLQGGPVEAAVGAGAAGQAGERRPRAVHRVVKRTYQLVAYDAHADTLSVKRSFTNRAEALDALRDSD